MESSWTKVRQMVANRVLTRHLQDLHEQQVAMEKAHEQYKRRLEREIDTSRSRTGSLQINSKGSLLPKTSKRHSLPFSPRPPANDTPPPTHRAPSGDHVAGTDRLALGLRPDSATSNSPNNSSNMLDLMANTLHSARSMEQQRPTLYLQTPTGKPDKEQLVQTLMSQDRPFAASLRNQRAKASIQSSTPLLERGETFLQTDQSQVLSLETAIKEASHRKGGKTKPRTQKGGETSNSETEGQPALKEEESRAKHGRPGRGKVSVDFYDEETGLKKEDGGFTPNDLSLPLNMLEEEETSDADQSVEDEEEGEEEESESAEEKLGLGEEKDLWSEFRGCQYIRGYDPPHMRMPKDAVKFVFGDSGQT